MATSWRDVLISNTFVVLAILENILGAILWALSLAEISGPLSEISDCDYRIVATADGGMENITVPPTEAWESFCFRYFLFCIFKICRLFSGSFVRLSPSITLRNKLIVVISSIGARFGCWFIASLSWCVASRIRSAGVSSGIAIAGCWNCTVSEICSPLVDGNIPWNDQKWFKCGPMYHAFLAFSP